MIDMLAECWIRFPMGDSYSKKKEKAFLNKLKKFLKEHNATISVDATYEA